MLPTPKPRRFIPFLLIALAVFFVVRQPEKTATFTTGAMGALTTVVEAFTTFVSHLG